MADKEQQLFNWQQVHEQEEQVALRTCIYGKTTLIPAFLQFVNTTYSSDLNNQTIKQNVSTGKLLINEIRGLVKSNFDKTNKCLLATLPVQRASDNENTNKFSKLLADSCEQMLKLATRPGNQGLLLTNSSTEVRGILPTFSFTNRKWMKVFSLCEFSSSRILYAFICYLEQNATISDNVHVVEYREADFFFTKQVSDALTENFHKMNIFMFEEHLNEFVDQIPLFGTLLHPFRKVLVLIANLSYRVQSISPAYRSSLLSTLFELLFNQLKCQESFSNVAIFLSQQHRVRAVLESARSHAVSFCVKIMKSLTATLFHFWISLTPISKADQNVLSDYLRVFDGIEDHVHAANHKLALLTQQTLRPYGFIMAAVLEDNLPTDDTEKYFALQTRQYLQECISLYVNWRFEFSTIYPPAIQVQSTQLSKVCSLFESMLLSLHDFQALLLVSMHLLENLQDKKKPLFFFPNRTLEQLKRHILFDQKILDDTKKQINECIV